jgi:hypothetical protein
MPGCRAGSSVGTWAPRWQISVIARPRQIMYQGHTVILRCALNLDGELAAPQVTKLLPALHPGASLSAYMSLGRGGGTQENFRHHHQKP